jgi:hypothetical protein
MEERIIAADPVADPQGYRRELLALLGDDDPAQVLAATLAELQERTGGLPDDLIARRPEPGEWSVAELLGHLWDAELADAFRARAILAQDRPQLPAYDQDAWAILARPPSPSFSRASPPCARPTSPSSATPRRPCGSGSAFTPSGA